MAGLGGGNLPAGENDGYGNEIDSVNGRAARDEDSSAGSLFDLGSSFFGNDDKD